MDDVGSGGNSDGGSGNSKRCSGIGGGLGGEVISLGSLHGGLIDGGDGTVGVGDEAGDVDGVGPIGVGKTSIAIAESTGIAVVTGVEEGSIGLSRPLSVPVAATVAATIAAKTSCGRTEKGSTTKSSDSSEFSLPLLDGMRSGRNGLPLAVSVAPVTVAAIAVSTAVTVAISGLSLGLPLAVSVAPVAVATIAISTAIAVSVAGLNGGCEGNDEL